MQVYFARALNWRGIFGVHTWVATKPENATEYTMHQVIGWRIYRDLPAVFSAPGIPDGRWFGNDPTLIAELRGDAAAKAIPKITRGDRQLSLPQRIHNSGPAPIATPSSLSSAARYLNCAWICPPPPSAKTIRSTAR